MYPAGKGELWKSFRKGSYGKVSGSGGWIMVENGSDWCEDRLGWRLLKELSLILLYKNHK